MQNVWFSLTRDSCSAISWIPLPLRLKQKGKLYKACVTSSTEISHFKSLVSLILYQYQQMFLLYGTRVICITWFCYLSHTFLDLCMKDLWTFSVRILKSRKTNVICNHKVWGFFPFMLCIKKLEKLNCLHFALLFSLYLISNSVLLR